MPGFSAQGDVDWRKSIRVSQDGINFLATLGVEVQVSGRSDVVAVDLVHLISHINERSLDAGVIIVPSTELANYLTDRTPNLKDAIRYLRHVHLIAGAKPPILLLGIEHEGFGPAIPKKRTNMGHGRNLLVGPTSQDEDLAIQQE